MDHRARIGRMQVMSTGGDHMLMGTHRGGRPAHHGQQIATVGLAADGPLGIDHGVEASPSTAGPPP